MLSAQTIRKVVDATARRLECSEQSVFLAFARSEGYKEEHARLIADGNYALYCEDSLDNDEIVDKFCLEVLCNRIVKVKDPNQLPLFKEAK